VHDAVLALAVERVQALPPTPNAPVLGEGVKVTVPLGLLGVVAVSVIVAVQVVAEPVATDEGAHDTAAVVWSGAASAGAAATSSAIRAPSVPTKMFT
jgi:hypothetical protein